MATRDDIVDRVTNLLGSDSHLSDAEVQTLVQMRYEHICDLSWWSQRRRAFTISTVAQVDSTSSDTVTVTNASATITSAGTPFTSAMTGRQIQIGSDVQQFFYFTYVSTSSGTLSDGSGNSVTWPGDTASGESWRIFKVRYQLNSSSPFLRNIISLAGTTPLEEIDGGQTTLDIMDPYRQTTDTEPHAWCYAGKNIGADGSFDIEVWPVPTTATLLRGWGVREGGTLSGSTVLDIPPQVLTWGVASDACGLLYAKEGVEHWSRLQGYYEGKYAAALKDAEFEDQSRRSLPTQLGQFNRGIRLLGTDYQISHQLPGE